MSRLTPPPALTQPNISDLLARPTILDATFPVVASDPAENQVQFSDPGVGLNASLGSDSAWLVSWMPREDLETQGDLDDDDEDFVEDDEDEDEDFEDEDDEDEDTLGLDDDEEDDDDEYEDDDEDEDDEFDNELDDEEERYFFGDDD